MMKRSALSLALLAASVTSLPALAQSAKDFELLRNEVMRLRKELDELKGQQAARPAPAPAVVASPEPAVDTAALTERIEQVELRQKDAVVAGDIPGSFRLPGSDTSIRLYGHVEVNAVHEFKGSSGDIDYSTFLPYAPLNGSTARKGETYLHARTSRIGIETSTPTSYGPLGIKLEGDFNNDPRLGGSAVSGDVKAIYTQQATNSYNFRLRQAVATFAGFTVGQTWSTFMDVDNAPETVDFNGPIGSTFIRQPVVRYTYATPDLGGLTVAVENPVSYALDASGSVTKSGFSKTPDLVLRWDKGYDWGAASLRGVTQEVKILSADRAVDAAKRGYGIAGTGLIKLRGGQDALSLGMTYGDGVGRYFNYLEGAIVDETANRILMDACTRPGAGLPVQGQRHPAGQPRRRLAEELPQHLHRLRAGQWPGHRPVRHQQADVPAARRSDLQPGEERGPGRRVHLGRARDAGRREGLDVALQPDGPLHLQLTALRPSRAHE